MERIVEHAGVYLGRVIVRAVDALRAFAGIEPEQRDDPSRREPTAVVLDGLVADLTRRLEQARRSLAVCIIDEKRLAAVSRQETANAAEWSRRALEADETGSVRRAAEARRRAGAHAAHARSYAAELRRQRADLELLKRSMRRLYFTLEDAKRARHRIACRWNASRAASWMAHDLCWASEAVRVLAGLAEIDPLDGDAAGSTRH
jgi:phage shock protein A